MDKCQEEGTECQLCPCHEGGNECRLNAWMRVVSNVQSVQNQMYRVSAMSVS